MNGWFAVLFVFVLGYVVGRLWTVPARMVGLP